MAKLSVSDFASIGNELTFLTTLNANFGLVEAAIENTLSRDGTSPNEMEADLDMNSNRILNLLAAVGATEPVRLLEFQGLEDEFDVLSGQVADALAAMAAALVDLNEGIDLFDAGMALLNAAVAAAQLAETNAETAETAAESAQAAAEAALALFMDQYLGAFAVEPLVDNDAGPLEAGDLYFDTVFDSLRVYDGANWIGTFAIALDDLTNVNITSPQDGEVLVYDSGDWVNDSVAAAVATFLDLTDTPNDYTGDALKLVRVNAGETALEFFTGAFTASAITFTPAGTIAATDVQAAIEELDTEHSEFVADTVGAMVTGNTETLITVTYQDADNTLDFVVNNDLSAYDNTTSAFLTQASADALFLTPAEGNAAYQPLDADLTSWAGVTRGAGFDTFTATPSSANLALLVTGETGSGALVFGTSPTLTTPDLGTPSALVLTSATGLTSSGVATATLVTAADTIATNDNDTTWPTTAAVIDYVGAFGSGATTALDNLAAVAINATLIPGTSDAVALGSTTKQWSDLFLAEGGVINWDSGDLSLTQTGNVLRLEGGGLVLNHSALLATYTGSTIAPLAQFHGTTEGTSNYAFGKWSADALASRLLLSKSRGATIASYTVVQDNDVLGTVAFEGADGTDLARGANIFARVDGTPGAGDMPTELVFATSADGSETPTERWFIGPTGSLGVIANGQTIELGTSGDTTLTRTAAGRVTVEAVPVNIFTSQATAPSSPLEGDQWFDEDTGTLFWYVDSQWAELTGGGGTIGTQEDLFLTEGGVINWDSGDVLLTQTGNSLALTGGGLVVGHTDLLATYTSSTNTPQQQGVGTAFGAMLSVTRFSASAAAPVIYLTHSRGATIGDYTVSNDNDVHGIIRFEGSDGTDFAQGASITARVDGTPGNNDMPTELVFSTSAAGSATPTERLIIGPDGGLTFPATENTNANANTLDDYEEGTFTPVILQTGVAPTTMTYTTQTARYTKIGNLVNVDINIKINAFTLGAGTGTIAFSALPFTSGFTAHWTTYTNGPDWPVAGTLFSQVASGTTIASIYVAQDNANPGALTLAGLAATDELYTSGSFTV